jgi:hypothetical protein
MKILASLVFVVALSFAADSFACSVMPEPPASKVANSHTVVLAIPIGSSIKATNAKQMGAGKSIRQTILWQVLVSWKGNHKAGDKFTTRRSGSVGPGTCFAPMSFIGREAHLMYLFDREPYAQFYALPPELAWDDLKYLSDRAGGP